MKFAEALLALDEGAMLTREGWGDEDLAIFKQIPAEIPQDTIPKMQSLPEAVKRHFEDKGYDHISYQHQYIKIMGNTMTYYTPDGIDMNSNDWKIVRS